MSNLLIYALIAATLLSIIGNIVAIRFIIKQFTVVLEFINEEEIDLDNAYLRIREGADKE